VEGGSHFTCEHLPLVLKGVRVGSNEQGREQDGQRGQGTLKKVIHRVPQMVVLFECRRGLPQST
jgi:hypothetical protein